jgi:hypothetical protein
MRNDAKDTNLPRRIDGRGLATLPAASTASASASAAAPDADLPGWVGDSGGYALPDPSTTSAAPGT